MKKLLFLAIMACMLTSCEEEGPYINFNNETDSGLIDTTYIAGSPQAIQLKNVLIEDFTGVRCPNCPNAAIQLAALKVSHPGRIVGIAVHAPIYLGTPYSVSKEDYRNFEDTMLWGLFAIQSIPVGMVDRVKYAPAGMLQPFGNWSADVNQRLVNPNSPININITKEYDSVTRVLKVLVEVFYNEANTFKNYLSISLIEDGIIDLQQNGADIDSFYHHEHILRKMMTHYEGAFLMENPEAKRVFRKQYKTTLKAHWKPEHMKIIAFVTKHNDAHDHDVFQVNEIDLK